jgi:RimJ/RimL family protein N-acetyltransferase
MKVIIRELRIEDAEISWRWRNDPEIWKLTGRKWNNHVSPEIEKDWIRMVIKDEKSKRFAICVGNQQRYVGNVQLTNITKKDAVFHIFIGEKEYWGKGIALAATKLLIEYAHINLKLDRVILKVNRNNIAALKVYEKVGFRISNTIDGDNYLMLLTYER